ncbi:uncharacterized protein B0T23DRAFT_200004 [Neurospora hispaniola]|uniref:Secreted protein n=1 Tax=Neurospora hispaniola TaxID=588809 RepID=A0AAJ0MPK0_9PEZI|nr:hypothetical protein B0T23DRAFT_200004 [Neurospora hispaniola]
MFTRHQSFLALIFPFLGNADGPGIDEERLILKWFKGCPTAILSSSRKLTLTSVYLSFSPRDKLPKTATAFASQLQCSVIPGFIETWGYVSSRRKKSNWVSLNKPTPVEHSFSAK